MDSRKEDQDHIQKSIRTTVEVSIRLVFLLLITGGCLWLLHPFITPVLGGVVLAVAVSPIYLKISSLLRNRRSISAAIVVLICLGIVTVPAGFFINSTVNNVKRIGMELQDGEVRIPPPNAKVNEWPFIGKNVFEVWKEASENIEDLLNSYNVELRAAGKWLLKVAVGVTWSIFQILLSIVIAGFMLATPGTKEVIIRFFKKLSSERGEEFVKISEITIQNVTKGILGVSILQAALFSIIFVLAGVPYVGIWTLLVLMIGIIQLPMSVATIPIIIYMFATREIGPAIAWSILVSIVGLVDNVLKPILMAQGASVPMLVIFLGAIGGFMVSGFLGLFAGAIFLSIGYNILGSWLNDEEIVEE
ncbi:MAG: AI-2E family transporter [Reichenbachiella sp.]